MQDYKSDLEIKLKSISNNEVKPDELENAFDKVAQILLRNTYINTDKKEKYSIREIEFYFFSDTHQDYYCDRKGKQSEFCKWYFAKYDKNKNPDPEKYSKNKWRRLDLTFGNESKGNYGGILLRAIQKQSDIVQPDDLIEGPGIIVTKLCPKDTPDLVKVFSGEDAFNENSPLYLSFGNDSSNFPIYKSKRVVGEYTNDEKKKPYINKLYRYFNYPEIKEVLRATV